MADDGALEDLTNSCHSYSLDLSRRELTEVPCEVSAYKDLENLYLEGNKLRSIPDSLFLNCLNLKWLDLRNNEIEVLPPSIDKLRSLKTLLLQGNRLVSLPAQLCRLSQLTGLNISHNPLQDPPREITDKGTKAVLGYLREMLDDEYDSSDSSSSLADSGEGSSTYIPLKPPVKFTLKAKTSALPTPEMKSIVLRPQSKPLSSKSRTPKKKIKKSRTEHAAPPIKPSQTESKKAISKAQINKSLDKLKSKQGLEEWRDQAKQMQKWMQNEEEVYQRAVDTAPFATQSTEKPESPEPVHQDVSTDVEKAVFMEQLVHKHMTKLEDKRKQAGIILNPSSQLQEAEKSLAEAIAMKEELERIKSKEYRLTAFTGDLPY